MICGSSACPVLVQLIELYQAHLEGVLGDPPRPPRGAGTQAGTAVESDEPDSPLELFHASEALLASCRRGDRNQVPISSRAGLWNGAKCIGDSVLLIGLASI